MISRDYFPFSDVRECLALYEELRACLVEEKAQLIACKIESLGEVTFRKDCLSKALSFKHRKFKQRLKETYGEDSPRFSDPLEQADWDKAYAEWTQTWQMTVQRVKENQDFLRHSLRNLDQLVGHFRRLLGDSTTYSAQGRRVDGRVEGHVVEARY